MRPRSSTWSSTPSPTATSIPTPSSVTRWPASALQRRYILAPGNSTDRAEAYRRFRGRDPEVAALLKKRGFPTTN